MKFISLSWAFRVNNAFEDLIITFVCPSGAFGTSQRFIVESLEPVVMNFGGAGNGEDSIGSDRDRATAPRDSVCPTNLA